jgi:hypothetical protein
MADGNRSRRLGRVAIVGGGVLLAANLFILAGLGGDNSSTPVLPPEIQRLYPNTQEVIRPQETVGADLRNDLQGELRVNGVDIGRDQLTGDPSLGFVTFRPGCASVGSTAAGNECAFREFEPGTYNLTVRYWPRTKSIDEAQQDGEIGEYSWQVKVG